MPAGSTYTPIATQTLGSSTASVTFSSIPSTYTDLVLIMNGSFASGGSLAANIQVGNGSVDTGTNYSVTYLLGNGSSGGSGRITNTTALYSGRFNTTVPGVGITHFMNYANTSTFKSVLSRGDETGNYVIAFANTWRSTAAINIMTIKAETGVNLSAGCTFTLYGIAAA